MDSNPFYSPSESYALFYRCVAGSLPQDVFNDGLYPRRTMRNPAVELRTWIPSGQMDVDPASSVSITRDFAAAAHFPINRPTATTWVYILDLPLSHVANVHAEQCAGDRVSFSSTRRLHRLHAQDVRDPRAWSAPLMSDVAPDRKASRRGSPLKSTWLMRCPLLFRNRAALFLLVCSLTGAVASARSGKEPLLSWNDGPAKTAIVSFVAAITKVGGPRFVTPEDRIAVFDSDGTLVVEKPVNINVQFAAEQLRKLAGSHPDWRNQQPFATLLDADAAYLGHLSAGDTLQLFLATFAGTEQSVFEQTAASWLRTARDARYARPYATLVYQPQIELLRFLGDNGFKVFIVSGGEIDFLRYLARARYAVPSERVIGSSVRYRYGVTNGTPTIDRVAELGSIDDGPAKATNIQLHIGKSPILAFGNSDGDEAMLSLTAANTKPHLVLVLHHDDAEREYAYDREAPAGWGKLDKVLDEAKQRDWQIVSMKADFKSVFAP